MTKIINLISSPRNISTALMYSFAQRKDTKVVDEPFYGYYLTKSKIEHPGQQEIIDSMEVDPQKIIKNIFNDHDKPVLFLKNMAHHLIDMDLSFLKTMVNLFLIRDPKRLIASFAKVIPDPGPTDIGVEKQYELFQMLQTDDPVVVDSGELLKDPQKVLQQVCKDLQIPFDTNMLSWPAGPIEEDGIWSRYWYKNVHRSTGFQKPEKSNINLPVHCHKLYESSTGFYKQMYKHAIKA
jgi:hypothetical protein